MENRPFLLDRGTASTIVKGFVVGYGLYRLFNWLDNGGHLRYCSPKYGDLELTS